MPASPTKQKAAPKLPVNPKSLVRNPEQTRAKLLQATIDLLVEKGPDALALKEVASRAHVSRAMAYKIFADKEHLLREAKAWMSDRLQESAKGIPAATKHGNVALAMEERVRSAAKLVLSNREAARLLISDVFAGKSLDADHPLYKLIRKNLRDLKKSGLAKWDFDIEILTFILLGSISTLIMLSYLPNAGDEDKLAERYTFEWSNLLGGGLFDTHSKSKPKLKAVRKSQPDQSRLKSKVKAAGAPAKAKIKKD